MKPCQNARARTRVLTPPMVRKGHVGSKKAKGSTTVKQGRFDSKLGSISLGRASILG